MKFSPTIQDQPEATLFPMRRAQDQMVMATAAGRVSRLPRAPEPAVPAVAAVETASAGGPWAFFLDVLRLYGEARARRELERHRPAIAAVAAAVRRIDATPTDGHATGRRTRATNETNLTGTRTNPT